jgi:hypothetical protein
MIFVLRFPLDSESWLSGTIGIHARESVEHHSPRQAVGLLPGIAFDLHAQRAAIVGAGTRGGRKRQQGYQTANCNLP